MASSASVAAPPPYTTDTPPSESTLPPSSTVQVTSSNIGGLRDQILDNTFILFDLAHGDKGRKQMPTLFRVATFRGEPNTTNSYSSNTSATATQTRAVILQIFSGAAAMNPFVVGPLADDTESALRALLNKLEFMIGKRWQSKPEKFVMNYLKD